VLDNAAGSAVLLFGNRKSSLRETNLGLGREDINWMCCEALVAKLRISYKWRFFDEITSVCSAGYGL